WRSASDWGLRVWITRPRNNSISTLRRRTIMNSTFTINNGNRIMKPKHAMDAIANSPRLGPWKAILAILGLLSMLPSGQAQTITPLQCGATATYYDTTGFYDCVHKCLD